MSAIISLGIESTAHTFGVGIVDGNCGILANEKSQLATPMGGILPREAFENHVKSATGVLEAAMSKAAVSWKDIDVIAFSRGPGLGPCLKVGAAAARMLSLTHGIPVLGVNHCVAHIEIGKKLTAAKDPLVVYASGANTQIIGYEEGRYRVYGETLDTGIGNLLDSFGRALGMGFPAGPKMDGMYFGNHKYVELPYSVKGMDLAFCGLLTAAESAIGKFEKDDLVYSLMHTAFAMLVEVSERALAHTEKKELLLTGGVAASKALRAMLGEMCEARGAQFCVPPFSVCVDNGAMIAWQGLLEYSNGARNKIAETKIDQRFRVDKVEVCWVKQHTASVAQQF